MRRSRKNPLIFDNRFAPDPMKRYPRSRMVASIVAPPRQRAQVERLADSPHTFRVLVPDDVSDLDLSLLSQPGCITLVLPLKEEAAQEARSASAAQRFGKGDRLGIYSAFTFLHRLGDVLLPILEPVVMGGRTYHFSDFKSSKRGTTYIPAKHLSATTLKFAKKVHAAYYAQIHEGVPLWSSGLSLSKYIVHNTNSHMARKGLRYESGARADLFDYLNLTQCLADWLALSEMPSARARPSRGEPWILFPPKPGSDWSPAVRRKILAYVKTINTYFPLFAQSLLDDLDGAVIRI